MAVIDQLCAFTLAYQLYSHNKHTNVIQIFNILARAASSQFSSIASEKNWPIITLQEFHAISNIPALNVRSQLNALKQNAIGVVVLFALSSYVPILMKQAKELDMIKGLSWIVGVSIYSFIILSVLCCQFTA